MSYLGTRNAIAVGIGGVASLSGKGESTPSPTIQDSLLTEASDYLVQEDDSLILLE